MKIIMTSEESGGVVMESEGKTLSEAIVKAIQSHTKMFGEEYLGELLPGLAELANGETEYFRREFSDPEANFKLHLVD